MRIDSTDGVASDCDMVRSGNISEGFKALCAVRRPMKLANVAVITPAR